jgi:hypothetical protein
VVYGTTFLNTVLAAFKTVASAALIATAKVRLSHNPSFVPNPGATITGLAAEECNYSGYAAGGVALVVGSPVNLSTSCQGAVTGLQFLATAASPFVSDNAYGYWVDDGTNVILQEAFPGGMAVPFGAPGDFLELILEIPQQATQPTS